MSSEPITRRSGSSSSSSNVNQNVHLPIALLALTIAVFMGAQISSISGQKQVLLFQIDSADRQKTQLDAAEKQYKNAWTQREPSVKQAVELQGKFQSLLSDLLELSKEDADAKKIVDDWKIQKPNPPAAPAADASAETK